MTSQLHKKHPTTPPSIPAESLSEGRSQKAEGGSPSLDLLADAYVSPSTAVARQEPLWLPAGLLAALLTLTMAISAVGAPPTQHEWRPIKPRIGKAELRHSTMRRATNLGTSAKHGAKHTVKRTYHRDRQVKPIGYDDNLYAVDQSGPELRVAQRGSARMHSIVVTNGSGQPERGYRFAQSDTRSLDAFEKQLEEPFGVEELPPQQDLRGEIDNFDNELPAVDNGSPAMGDELSPNALPELDERTAPRDPFDAADEEDEDELELEDLDDDFDDLDDEIDRRRQPKLSKAEREAKERSQVIQDCSEELAKLKANRLSGVDIHIGLSGQEGKDYPYQCSIDQGEVFTPRCWEQVCYMWKASALCHKPLYFEQKHLERYGHSWGPYLDPVVSGAHFFTRLPVLPYCMGIKAPNECVYTLGHYRPGSCAPYMIEPIPFTWRAALMEAGAWSSGVLAIP